MEAETKIESSNKGLDAAVAVAVVVLSVFMAWASGAAGIVMGLAGFIGWNIHPNWLVALLT